MLLADMFVVIALLTLCRSAGASEISPEGPLTGPYPWRRLFLDAMVVEESQGVKRVFHKAQKYAGNPIMVKDHPWEGVGPNTCAVIQEEGKFRMWYYGTYGGKSCYAESTDGIQWTKPNLGLIEYEGSTANNICDFKGGVVMRVRKPVSPQSQYVVFGARKASPCVAFSADGLNWRWDEGKFDLYKTSDVMNYFYDPYKERYVATYKTPNRRHRAVGLAYSENATDWYKPVEGAVFGADDYDPDGTQIYGMPVFPYQGLYIGMPWIYHARFFKYGEYTSPQRMYEAETDSPRFIDTQMAWSWNLISWNRTVKRKPFLELGAPGSWDCGMVLMRGAPIPVGDKLFFYYAATDRIHDVVKDVRCCIGIATLRLDGFCSLRARDKEGWVISRREVFKAPRVTLNAKTRQDGYVVAELLDRNNNVVEGFSREACIPFQGDSVNATLSWKSTEFPKEMLEPDKKIRFFFRNADLYSYLPEDIDTEQDTSNRKEH
ncbi:MAG TPA: hypothetical protein PKH07_13660 [bacterium]|nr:hypothetical protein [bacterium]